MSARGPAVASPQGAEPVRARRASVFAGGGGPADWRPAGGALPGARPTPAVGGVGHVHRVLGGSKGQWQYGGDIHPLVICPAQILAGAKETVLPDDAMEVDDSDTISLYILGPRTCIPRLEHLRALVAIRQVAVPMTIYAVQNGARWTQAPTHLPRDPTFDLMDFLEHRLPIPEFPPPNTRETEEETESLPPSIHLSSLNPF